MYSVPVPVPVQGMWRPESSLRCLSSEAEPLSGLELDKEAGPALRPWDPPGAASWAGM